MPSSPTLLLYLTPTPPSPLLFAASYYTTSRIDDTFRPGICAPHLLLGNFSESIYGSVVSSYRIPLLRYHHHHPPTTLLFPLWSFQLRSDGVVGGGAGSKRSNLRAKFIYSATLKFYFLDPYHWIRSFPQVSSFNRFSITFSGKTIPDPCNARNPHFLNNDPINQPKICLTLTFDMRHLRYPNLLRGPRTLVGLIIIIVCWLLLVFSLCGEENIFAPGSGEMAK